MGIINVILAIIIVFLVGTALLLSYLQSLKIQVAEMWFSILNNLRTRADMIPLLIEIVRKNNPSLSPESIENLIAIRAKSWRLEVCDGEKVSTELDLSQQVKEILRNSDQNDGINKNYLYLSLKKELQEISDKIEKMEDQYNQKVRQYNAYFKFFLFIPVFKLFKLQKFSIFEFEY